MPRILQDVCDRCGAIRRADDRWLLFQFLPDSATITIASFDPSEPHPAPAAYRLICGPVCLRAELETNLAELRASAPRP